VPSPAEVANFQGLILKLGVIATTRVATLFGNVSDYQTVKDAYPATVDPYIAASSTLSAQWYDQLDLNAAFATESAPPPPATLLETSAGWALGQLDPLGALIGSTERHIFKASRDTVALNAKREGVKYARYASANACPWCRVLATREAAYHTADNAVKGHDNCHCIAVPVRGGDVYTPPDYVAAWTKEYQDARDAVGGKLNDIVNHMRRNN
jgi:hypothetical protein